MRLGHVVQHCRPQPYTGLGISSTPAQIRSFKLYMAHSKLSRVRTLARRFENTSALRPPSKPIPQMPSRCTTTLVSRERLERQEAKETCGQADKSRVGLVATSPCNASGSLCFSSGNSLPGLCFGNLRRSLGVVSAVAWNMGRRRDSRA